MKNNRGVTLVSMIVIIIVIIIIASIGVISGNALLLESKDHVSEQEYVAVLDAVKRKKAEVSLAGTLLPASKGYIGIQNPVVGRDEGNLEQYAGKDWYLLEETHLEQLGIERKSKYVYCKL